MAFDRVHAAVRVLEQAGHATATRCRATPLRVDGSRSVQSANDCLLFCLQRSHPIKRAK
jgi:hypothetical protein